MGFGGGPRHMMAAETSKPANVGKTLSRLARYFKPYWFILTLVLVMMVANTWTQVISPKLTGQAVDCFIAPGILSRISAETPAAAGQTGSVMGAQGQNTASGCTYKVLPADATTQDYIKGLGQLILVVLGLFAFGSIAGGLQFYLMTYTGQHILRGLREEIFAHMHKLSLNYYAENEAGNVMSRLTNDIDTITQVLNFALISVTSGILLLVWITYTMLAESIPFALISMAVVPFMVLLTTWLSGLARKAYRRTRVEIGKVNAELQESISGVREVQAFGREDANIETFRTQNAANRDANIKAVTYPAILSPALEALGYLAIAVVTITGGLTLLRGTTFFGTAVTLGLVVTFLGYVQRFNQPIQQISTLWTNIQSAIAGAERIFALLDTQPEVVDVDNAIEMPEITGKVEFDRVVAAYTKDVIVLDDVSFTAEPGQTVAIVGPTGAGKTTIINLIPRFYDLVSGQIRIDGIDIHGVKLASLRRQVGIVLQDTILFNDTVMNNIRFGKPEATDDEVLAAAKLSHADDFIQRLPLGYQTVLGEHGAGLSQGQRQLVAIARAALVNPRILILDEATSSVDTRTERLIQRALDILLRGRTSFVIAHRLSTIRNADQVLVIEDGKIVESGKHTELLALRGAYYELYMRQFRKEEEGETPAPSAGGMLPAPAGD